MSKTCSDPGLIRLAGPTMGTRWTAALPARPDLDPARLQAALQAAVDEIDAQMSTWKPESDLMRLNAAPIGEWVPVPAHLLAVLALGLRIGRASGGAFDIGMGRAVRAWGFGLAPADPADIRAAMGAPRMPAGRALLLDPGSGRACKRAALDLDLNGIAKGYGVDRLAETLAAFGVTTALLGIDGEMRALGQSPAGRPWAIAVEAPDPDRRAPHSLLALQDGAVATSGDYRHRITVAGRSLSHTMDPDRAAPLADPPASVSVIAPTCAEADAWATALMVLGPSRGAALAARCGLNALFLLRKPDGIRPQPVGPLFGGPATSGPGRAPVARLPADAA